LYLTSSLLTGALKNIAPVASATGKVIPHFENVPSLQLFNRLAFLIRLANQVLLFNFLK